MSPQSSANTSTRSWVHVSPIKSPVTRLTRSPSPTRSVSGSSPLSYSLSGMADRIGIVARFENAIVIEESPTGLRALFSHIPKSDQTV